MARRSQRRCRSSTRPSFSRARRANAAQACTRWNALTPSSPNCWQPSGGGTRPTIAVLASLSRSTAFSSGANLGRRWCQQGATAWDGDKQFCHSPASIGLYACVFAEAGLMEVVDAQLRSSGYTKELHEALLKVGTLVQSHVCTYKRRREHIVRVSSLTSSRSEGCRQYMIVHTQYSCA